MANFTHDQLSTLSKPASDTEEEKLENAKNAIVKALENNLKIDSKSYEIFGQGSYENNTNVRNNSDVDINVCYTGGFYFDIPTGKTRDDYGLTHSCQYSFEQYKNDIEDILVQKFGRSQVVRKNKCLHVKPNTYHAEIDVVPTWIYRKYFQAGTYREGVCLYADKGGRVVNYPKQHKENGVLKNKNTSKRYKSLVRIIKNLSIKMEDSKFYSNNNITSFLIECLTYNYPNARLTSNVILDWNSILKDYISFFWNKAQNAQEWENWLEVSEYLYLMYDHKWSAKDVEIFMLKLWNYLGYQYD